MDWRRAENPDVPVEAIKFAFAGGNAAKRCRQSSAARIAEAVDFATTAEHFADAFAASWNMGAGVFFCRVGREVILAAAGGIDEFEFDVVADTFEMAIAPELPVVSRRRAAALPHRAIVGSASRMRIDFVRRTPDDVNVAAISFPTGDAGGEVFVGVDDAAVVFFLEFVDGGVGIGIVVLPENFNELFALFICAEAFESGNFARGEEIFPIFFQELAEVEAEFVLGLFLLLLLLSLGSGFLWRWGGCGNVLCVGDKAESEHRRKSESCKARSRMAHGTPRELKMGRPGDTKRVVIRVTRTARCTVRIRERVEGCPCEASPVLIPRSAQWKR